MKSVPRASEALEIRPPPGGRPPEASVFANLALHASQARKIRPPPGYPCRDAVVIDIKMPHARQALAIRPPPGGRSQKASEHLGELSTIRMPVDLSAAVPAKVHENTLEHVIGGSSPTSAEEVPKTPEAVSPPSSSQALEEVCCCLAMVPLRSLLSV
jgi:hypothetical protein